jgi:hypothetical protein
LEKALINAEQEYAIRSKLKWQHDGADWILLHGRRRMGRVVPDGQYPGMWRSAKSRGLSDMANLSWARDAVVGAALRELEWRVAQDAATDPRKCPENRGANRLASPHVRLNPSPLSLGLST